MKFLKTMAIIGAAISVVGAVTVAPVVGATEHPKTEFGVRKAKKENKIVKLKAENNAAVEVRTELDCMNHTLVTHVTNKTNANIMPNVTFNDEMPTFPDDSSLQIEPGKTGDYIWSFSGNNFLVNTKIQVDGQEDLMLPSTLQCSEPVSFKVAETSESAVTGMLTNNSSFVSQTVFTRVNGGDVRVETLEPGESRLVAMPFNTSYPDPQSAFVVIGTNSGYEGSYNVDLTKAPIEIL